MKKKTHLEILEGKLGIGRTMEQLAKKRNWIGTVLLKHVCMCGIWCA